MHRVAGIVAMNYNSSLWAVKLAWSRVLGCNSLENWDLNHLQILLFIQFPLFFMSAYSHHIPKSLLAVSFTLYVNLSFPLEFFRPWSPFQNKAQLRGSLDICRCPKTLDDAQ
jgi:hypothetical protein